VEEEINRILKNYKVGTKRNPLGRSGLLGLNTLKMRLTAEKDQVEMIQKTVISALEELTANKQIKLENIKLDYFVNKNFKAKVDLNKNESNKIKSLKKMSEVASSYKEAAKAYFLPQVGVFAQSNQYRGERDTASSQMIGLSVKWEFFNLTTFSTSKEAGAKANAAQAYAKAMAQQELLKNQMNLGKQLVVEKNLKRLSSALKDMKEQTQINYRLFKNGIINVLQLSQVLNSKLDLIRYNDQAQNEYLKTWSELFINKVSMELR
jgi:sulfur transfer complex TusBCD TusB component (DsrH family)